jgi:Ca-activated chloride channel homolog
MRKKLTGSFLVKASVLVILISAPVYAEQGHDQTLSPYFFVEGGDFVLDRFPLKDTDVTVNISGVIADVLVTQTYANEGTRPINARYVFPASTRAAVHGLKMVVGNQVVTARIKEREAAKQEFQEAKKEGKSASLLEQQRPNVFTMSVANVMPNDKVRIELHYTELLTPSEGTYEFVYPTVAGPRYPNQTEAGVSEATAPKAAASETDQWVKSPYLQEGSVPPTKFNIGVTLSTGIPLRELSCPSHEVDEQWDSQSVARVSLAQFGEFGGNRDFVLRYRLAGDEIQSGLMLYEGEKENFFLLMVQPPERVKPSAIPPREYIFILDVSGSMHGFPLDTAKVLIKDLIGHLRETDRFNVILFSGASIVMAPSSVPATQQHVLDAIRLIDAQKGGGGTELSPALATAFSLPRDEAFSRSVVIITDGYIAAEKETFELMEKNLNRANVFSFGIGSSVNRYLVEGIAKAGLGEPFVVTKPEDAAESAARFRAYVESPLLTNLQVRFDGFEAYHVEPPSIPDLFAKRPLVLFGKWRATPNGEIMISGKEGTGDYACAFNVSETKPLKAHGALPYLWARSRIARLSDFAAGTMRGEHKEEITSLGLAYNLLTQNTSFVAVLEKIRNTESEAADVNQPLPLPQHVSNLAVGDPSMGGAFAATPEPELGVLLALMILILMVFVRVRRHSMEEYQRISA